MLKKVMGVAAGSLLATETTVNAQTFDSMIDKAILNIQTRSQNVRSSAVQQTDVKVSEAQEGAAAAAVETATAAAGEAAAGKGRAEELLAKIQAVVAESKA